MILDDLDIEIEDDDGTGYRNGTVRYENTLVPFTVVQDSSVEKGDIIVVTSNIPFFIRDNWDEVKKIILEIAK